MSADRRKRKRKHQVLLLEQKIHEQTPLEKTMARQGKAINFMQANTVKVPRLNFTYILGGFAVPSGKRHRHIG